MSEQAGRFKGAAVSDRCSSGTKLHPRKTTVGHLGFSGSSGLSLPQYSAERAATPEFDAIRRRCSQRTQEDTA